MKLLVILLVTFNIYVWGDEAVKTDDGKSINITINNTPVNTNVNTNTSNSESMSDGDSGFGEHKDDREYFFFRAGLSGMKISDSDYSETGISMGIQYFAHGLKDEGFGLGFAMDSSWQESYINNELYELYETAIEYEIMYNLKHNGYSIVPAYVFGTLYQDIYKGTVLQSTTSVAFGGLGVYLNFPSIVKKGHGLSLFFKRLYLDTDQDLDITGVQFIW